jgi:hypothetical protein
MMERKLSPRIFGHEGSSAAAHTELRQIPAIVVTGEDIRPNAAVEQAKQILRKPCPPDRLVSAVERCVRAA